MKQKNDPVYNTSINFLGLPDTNPATARAVVIPVPFDATSTWKKGADLGPAAIIDASAHLELYDIETDTEVYKQGIYTHKELLAIDSLETMLSSVSGIFNFYAEKNLLPIILGGEHSVSIGAIQAAASKYNNLSVLQLDAHTDLRSQYEGSPFNHACVMARAKEKAPIVQVGIRSMDISEKTQADFSRIFFAEQIHGTGDWMDKVAGLLTGAVYITVDLDVFDPAVMPSTGTPEPGGLQWYEVIRLLKLVFKSKRVVGFDIVELCPGANHSADFLAAKLIYKMLSYYFYYNAESDKGENH